MHWIKFRPWFASWEFWSSAPENGVVLSPLANYTPPAACTLRTKTPLYFNFPPWQSSKSTQLLIYQFTGHKNGRGRSYSAFGWALRKPQFRVWLLRKRAG